MNCIICSSKMIYYFTKFFEEYGLGSVDYYKCDSCGFCLSKNHVEMSDDDWKVLNHDFHVKSHGSNTNPFNRNQRYFNQSLMLYLMNKHDLIEHGSWLDWGAGNGVISNHLLKYFDLELHNYDMYFSADHNKVSEDELKLRGYNLVVNSGVFEHVRSRETLDRIEGYVKEDGCLAIHTLVAEEIPRGPDWMYLLPVHCSFHTNHSMDLLMKQWGYTSSVYNESSKLWVLFKGCDKTIKEHVDAMNNSLGWEYLYCRSGFVDYWK